MPLPKVELRPSDETAAIVRASRADRKHRPAPGVQKQAEAAAVGIIVLGQNPLPRCQFPGPNPALKRQGTQLGICRQTVFHAHIGAGVNRLHTRGRFLVRQKNCLVTGTLIHLQPQPRDAEAVRHPAADMKPDRLPGRNALAIRVGVQSLQLDCLVSGGGPANRLDGVQGQDNH